MKGLGDLPTDALDTAYGLHIEFLWWELDGGVAGMDTGKLDML